MMTPTTFDMPNEIDDAVDTSAEEQHEYQGTDLSEEAANEVGQVEDAEPGQDWNAEGVFIGAAEIIEVPFRRTVKSKATVRVVHDTEDADDPQWRAGWHWKSLLKKPGQSELGREIRRTHPGFRSRIEAVNNALREMAETGANFDPRIGQDVLKYRDMEWHVDEKSGAEDSDALPTEDGPFVSNATDPETQEAIEDLKTVGIETGEPVCKTPPSEEELQAKAEADFRRKYVAAAEMMADAVLERRRAEEIFKTAKATEKMHAEMLEQLVDRGPERLPIVEYAERNAVTATESLAKTTEPVASGAWKSASIDVLNLPKGITAKLVDDGIDAVGRLEQRRADIAMKREKWPAGIGKSSVDKIEDAVVSWLSKNQHADQATEPEPVEIPAEAVAAAEATSDREIDPEIGDVVARVAELLDWTADTEDGSYQSGREAYAAGSLLVDCPLTPGDDQDQWLMGWSDAKEASGGLDEAASSPADDAADDLGDL